MELFPYKRMMNKKREENYDLLRIVSAIAVIMIHVSAGYKTAITSDAVFGQLYERHQIEILLYNTLSRFAVPCFVMLAGAFALADDRNSIGGGYYKKCFRNIGIPTIVFSVFYFLFEELKICLGIMLKGNELQKIFDPIKAFVKGAPSIHMWYLYMMIGVYLLVPFLIRIKKEVGETIFFRISIVMLLLGCISGWTSSFKLHWGISKSVCYLGYFMMGYQFRRLSKEKKNNKTGILLIGLGILAEIILTYIVYQYALQGIAEGEEKYSLIGNFNPLVVLASLFIFFGFSKLHFNCNLNNMASHTFYIYLFHVVVLDILQRVVKKLFGAGDARVIIPLEILLCFILSYLCSGIYMKVWKKISRR